MKLTAVLVLLAFAPNLFAAVITLDNGDRVTGDIVQIEGGKLTLKTPRMGEVVIDMGGVARIESDTPVAAVLASGDLVIGTVSTPAPGRIRFTSSSGSFESAVADVQRMRPAAGIDTGDGAFQEALALFEGPDRSPWSGSIEFGGFYSSGNTDRKGLNIAANAVRETPDDKFAVHFHNLYAEESGERTTNEQYLSMREDLKFDPWYAFVLLSFERDEFEEINLRAMLSPGVGVKIFDGPDFRMSAEAGPTLTFVDYKDDFFDDPDEDTSQYYIEARAALHAEWNILGDALLYQDLAYFPNFSEGGECRVISETGFSKPLSESLVFKIAAINEYNSMLENPQKNHDLKVIASLIFKF
jgi:putative salt-induced outer membrane protein